MVPDKKTGEEKKRERVQDNVLLCRAFWIDLDVKPDPSAYATQQDAIVGLGAFLKASGLPVPLVVSSGNGLHCYWPLTEDILPQQWQTAARMLKSLAAKLGLKQDPTRTSDHASVLRPVGTHNRKDPSAPKPVVLVRDAEPLAYLDLYRRIESACRSEGVDTPTPPKRTEESALNEKFLVASDYPDSHAALIADRCPQIRAMRDTGGKVSEPVWYGAIQVLRCTVEGRDIIHAWSSGYSGYSPDETDKKIAQVESMGPLTCTEFENRNPGGCVGCPYKGKISSPILLGIQRKALEAPVVTIHTEEGAVVVQAPNPPSPFLRTKDGVFVEIEGGAQQKVIGCDFYFSEIIDDEHMATHQMRAHVKKPMDPHETFLVPTDITGSAKEYEKWLRSKTIVPDNMKLFSIYTTDYIKNLQAQFQTKKLMQSMGWKDDRTAFVVGRKVFNIDGGVSEDAVGGKVKQSAAGFGTKGDFAEWVNKTAVLAQPGLEAQAFTLLLGFGAPLLEFTGLKGVTFAAIGTTGTGKTTTGHWLMSIWGDPDKVHVGVKDTLLARMERISVFGSLPAYMDESTELTKEEKSALAYQMSRGEGRRRLQKDGTEKSPLDWTTFLITSSNKSWLSDLGGMKHDAQAEQVRVFEYDMHLESSLGPTFQSISKFVAENYGYAGEAYVKELLRTSGELRAQIDKVGEAISKLANCQGFERFWVAGAACAIVGGVIAQRLGLIKFDVARLIPWVVVQIKNMRAKVTDSKPDEVALLSAYLNEFSDNRVVISKFDQGIKNVDPLKRPHGELLHHYEVERGVMWINKKHIRSELGNRRQNEVEFEKLLVTKGIITNPSIKFTLGRGTPYASGQVVCWQINMKHDAFSDYQEKVDAASE